MLQLNPELHDSLIGGFKEYERSVVAKYGRKVTDFILFYFQPTNITTWSICSVLKNQTRAGPIPVLNESIPISERVKISMLNISKYRKPDFILLLGHIFWTGFSRRID